jgi:hypothetical protein
MIPTNQRRSKGRGISEILTHSSSAPRIAIRQRAARQNFQTIPACGRKQRDRD